MSSLLPKARQTRGERIVAGLLRQLSEDYYAVSEPMIHSPSGSKRPDFIVVARNLGVAVIEVKDWREIIEATQREFTIRRADGQILVLPNPAVTAREYALDLAQVFERHKALLSHKFGRARLSFPWQEVVVLTNISRYVIRQLEEHNIFAEGIALGAEDLTDVSVFEEALTRLPWRFYLSAPLNHDTLTIIRSVIDPRIIIQSGEAVAEGVETPLQSALIREVPKIEERPATPVDETLPAGLKPLVKDLSVRLVRGVAGAGKTLVLTRRVQFLREHFPHYRVLVLSFNVDLAEDLKRRINMPDVTVIGFHKLCRHILGDAWRSPVECSGWLNRHLKAYIEEQGLSVEFVAEEIKWRKDVGLYDDDAYLTAQRSGRGQALNRSRREIINAIFRYYREAQAASGFYDWEDVPHLAYEALLHTPDHPWREAFHFVLVDEAQDFAPSWFNVVKAVMKPEGTMLVCDDPTQSMFKYFSWKEKGLHVQGRTSVLRVPFRSTREITRAAYSLVEADPILSAEEDILPPKLIGELRSGEPPVLRQCASWAGEVAFIEQGVIRLLEEGIPAREIAILCHDNRDVASFGHLTKRGIYVRAYGKMKGLEFWAVFLPRLNTLFAGPEAGKDEAFISQRRRRLYVGMTRARQWLALSYHDVLPPELEPLLPYVSFAG